ncbi:hypothetical protein BDQ94DRAFT_123513 [Aspergillus welwitschiae]|uniref:Uncharacterized protein n=1 Tax=Aspergillus welwitschiae TaxID=1341132 RepID=A0A3F3PJ60_9EURO|nr:hypothetical protein BDQ94DRAFT_123513 [Aspergillus welwitschiae]RDH26984.1 hypothetical protein BDQ94DRAFT_123513 [Aspergillus welwitschiae]
MMVRQSNAVRSISAPELLDFNHGKLNELQEFLENDQTAELQTITQVRGDTNCRIRYLLEGSGGEESGGEGRSLPARILFMRLLTVIYLATRYETWLQFFEGSPAISFPSGRPKRHGYCQQFIRENDLPPRAKNWISCGQKIRRIEKEVGMPGISLALMFSLPKFPLFPEHQVTISIDLLRDGHYPRILAFATSISEIYWIYTLRYQQLIDTVSETPPHLLQALTIPR